MNEKNPGKETSSLIICILLYLGLIIFIGKSSAFEKSYNLNGYILNDITIKGISAQFQLLILVFMVLRTERLFGFWIAIVLNTCSFVFSIAFMIKTNSANALPGSIAYVGGYLVLTLIFLYRRKISAHIRENRKQRVKLLASEERLRQMAYYDKLTGLPNRSYFLESLNRDISLAKRYENMLSVIFIDLDSFKNINDTLGHNAGDKALLMVSQRVTAVMRSEDVLSRFGGDEFLMNVGNLQSIEDINIIADKIIEVFKEPLVINNVEFFTTASIGIAVFPFDGENGEHLIKNADMAMYTAKQKGKNQFAFCSREMREINVRKLSLTNRLHRAIEKQELYLLYQPQLRVGTREIVGFEALLRWNNDKYGYISPGEFIPMAEQTGLIRPIGLWVFREVCMQYNLWKDMCKTDLRMSVNMSVEQLKDDQVMQKIEAVLKDTGVTASALELEITESAAFGNSFDVINKLVELRKMGFQIAIDDFGKEYSSLNRIRTYPVDRLKIDMDFVHAISSGESKDRALVKTIIQFGRNLGISVIAEGVETQEQYDFLEQESCHEVQGFLFYKGMLPEEIGKLFGN